MAKLSSGAEIRKLFVSSDLKYRLPGGTYSQFTTEVQGDIISCGNPCYFCIADLCLPNSIYNVTSVNQNVFFRVRTSSHQPHTFQDYGPITIPSGQYTASQIATQLSTRMSAAASPVSFAWAFSSTTNKFTCTVSNGLGVIFADDAWLRDNDFTGTRITNPKNISSMIGLPHPADVAMDSYGYTVSITEQYAKPAALIRLHSIRLNCRELSGHCMDELGSVQTVKKATLNEEFGLMVQDTANVGEMDWHPCSGATLEQFNWTLVDGAEQNPVELGQPISFSICFSDNPGV